MADLTYSNVDATTAAETLFSGNVEIVDASLIGSDKQVASYENGDAVADELTPSDTGLIFSTGKAENATNAGDETNQKLNTSGKMKTEGSEAIEEHTDYNTYDAAGLEVTFIPEQDSLTFSMTFASEEFPEYVGSIYNDMAAVYVNGELIPITGTENGLADVNAGNFYNNTDGSINTEFDGVTAGLTVTASLNPGEENTIKIVIADVGDNIYDSAILIAGDAIQVVDEADLPDLLSISNDDSETVIVDGTDEADVMHEEHVDHHGDIIDGVDGDNDIILGYGGADDIKAGEGNDLASGGNVGSEWTLVDGAWVYNADAVKGGGEAGPNTDMSDDKIAGGAGDDVLLGGYGNDHLMGDDGNDTLNAGEGDDIVDGGIGDDVLNLEAGADYATGGEGNDTINAGSGDDIAFGGAGDDKLRGDDGADQLSGDAGNDEIFGGTGNDTIDGGTDDDSLFGGDGDDHILGGEGNDYLAGEKGNDTLDGGAGDDRVMGGTGNDILSGGVGADKLVGGAGADVIAGGEGNDHMWGGEWSADGSGDTFIVSAGGGKDMIHDFETDNDQIDLSSYGLEYADVQGLMSDKGWATEIDLSGLTGGSETDKIIIKSVDADDLDESNFIL
ncbi:MAG: choice-of-anchor L domain-containing protein [Pseudoruegeria sp.]